MHYTKPSASRLLELMEQHIVILDGAMGTMIQQHNLTEEEFRGKGYLEKTLEYLLGFFLDRNYQQVCFPAW